MKAPSTKKAAPKAPWLLLILLAGAVYLFAILPFQVGPQPVHVEFVSDHKR